MTENGAKAHEAEGSRRTKFAHGRTAAVDEFPAAGFRDGRLFTSNVFRILPDRVEEAEHRADEHKQTRAISFQRVPEGEEARDLVWSTIAMEFTGGRFAAMEGSPKGDVERVGELLDDGMPEARGGGVAVAGSSAPPPPVIDVADH